MACSKCKSTNKACSCKNNVVICRPVCAEPVPCVNPCPCVETPNVGVITNTATVVTSGTLDRVIAANVKVSTLPNNSITIAADGLYATTTPVTLVDNNDRTFTFNNSVNPPTSFCQGLTSIEAPAGCEGVGASNMLRSASLDGCTLTLSSAPEHTTIAALPLSVSALPNTVVSADTDYFSDAVEIVVHNTSTCRSANVSFSSELSIDFEGPGTAFQFIVALQASFDLGPFTDLQIRASYAPAATLANRWEVFSTRNYIQTLVPTQLRNVRTRIRFRPVSVNATVKSYVVGNQALGSTV